MDIFWLQCFIFLSRTMPTSLILTSKDGMTKLKSFPPLSGKKTKELSNSLASLGPVAESSLSLEAVFSRHQSWTVVTLLRILHWPEPFVQKYLWVKEQQFCHGKFEHAVIFPPAAFVRSAGGERVNCWCNILCFGATLSACYYI